MDVYQPAGVSVGGVRFISVRGNPAPERRLTIKDVKDAQNSIYVAKSDQLLIAINVKNSHAKR